MAIIGLTDRGAQLPRLGILRKGAPKPNEKQPGRDLGDHFRFECDDPHAAHDFTQAYGDKPNHIRVMFYYASAAENFETWQEHHSAGALKHRCDGQTCVLSLLPNGTYSHERIPCPSIALKQQNPNVDKKHLCRPVGRLKVIIPELQRMAYVLIPTTSINDILELQANLEAAQALRGDLRGIPFVLSRRPRKVSTPGSDGQRARREKWLLSIEPEPAWVRLQLASMQHAALPGGGELLALPAAGGASYVDPTTGEVFDDDEPEEENCDGERELLKQLRNDLRVAGGEPWALTQKQVLAMSCEQIRAEIDATGAAIDALKPVPPADASWEEEYAAIEEAEAATAIKDDLL